MRWELSLGCREGLLPPHEWVVVRTYCLSLVAPTGPPGVEPGRRPSGQSPSEGAVGLPALLRSTRPCARRPRGRSASANPRARSAGAGLFRVVAIGGCRVEDAGLLCGVFVPLPDPGWASRARTDRLWVVGGCGLGAS